jgi:hypothetical protein
MNELKLFIEENWMLFIDHLRNCGVQEEKLEERAEEILDNLQNLESKGIEL